MSVKVRLQLPQSGRNDVNWMIGERPLNKNSKRTGCSSCFHLCPYILCKSVPGWAASTLGGHDEKPYRTTSPSRLSLKYSFRDLPQYILQVRKFRKEVRLVLEGLSYVQFILAPSPSGSSCKCEISSRAKLAAREVGRISGSAWVLVSDMGWKVPRMIRNGSRHNARAQRLPHIAYLCY